MRAEPSDDLHRAVPRRARRDPDRRARQDGRRFEDALAPSRRGADARALVPGGRVRHPLRRQVAHLARRSDRRRRQTARHQRRRRRDRRGGGRRLPTGRSARRVRVLGVDRAGATRPGSVQHRRSTRPDHRRAGRGLARGSVRMSASRRPRRGEAVPAGRQLRQPARHRPVPGLGAARQPTVIPVTARSSRHRRRTHRRRGPGGQAGRAGGIPGVVSVDLRACEGRGPCLREERPAVPRPLLPTPRGGRWPDRSGPAGRHRRCHERRHRPHVRSRRPAGRTRRPAPEVVHPVRRGDEGAVLDRPDRRRRHHRGRRRRRAHFARRHRPDAAGGRRHRRGDRRRGAAAVVLRGASAARDESDAGRRRPVPRRPRPARST